MLRFRNTECYDSVIFVTLGVFNINALQKACYDLLRFCYARNALGTWAQVEFLGLCARNIL